MNLYAVHLLQRLQYAKHAFLRNSPIVLLSSVTYTFSVTKINVPKTCIRLQRLLRTCKSLQKIAAPVLQQYVKAETK